MRKQRLLIQDAWYKVRTTINNRELLFRWRQAIPIFCQMFGEARGRFTFELRGFRLGEERLSFYIRPADGLQLPAIMQWLKQTFAVRFNLPRLGRPVLLADAERETAGMGGRSALGSGGGGGRDGRDIFRDLPAG